MKKTKAALAITIIGMTACQTAQEPLPPSAGVRDALPPISEKALAGHVETLSSDAFEGRAPGTAGGAKTRAYLAGEMRRLGLEPLGDSFEHPVTLVSRTLDTAQSTARVELGRGFDELSYGPEAIFWSKRAAPRISVQGSEVVFVGHGIVAPEYGWNDYAGIDARGKTVVMLINDPGFRRGGEMFDGRAMTYYGRWTYKYEEAARQGAEAAIIVHQTDPASYGWNVIQGSGDTRLDLPRADGAPRPLAVEGWITAEQADALFTAAGVDFEAMEKAASRPGFEPVPLAPLTFSAELFHDSRLIESANVAGVLRGGDRPDEYVLYTAHWDHLGRDRAAEAAGRDGIYNGAVDNATGTAGILAIAESWVEAGLTPRRSHLFVAVTAEESGLLGSKAFASAPPVPLADIIGGINIDAMLPTGPQRDLTVVGYGASELEDILREVAAAKGQSLSPDPSPEAGYFYRSDHVEFAKRGVPMLYVDGGTDLVEGGVEAGRAAEAAYRADAYHAVGDDYNPDTWRFDGIAATLTTLRDVGAVLSEDNVEPNWYPGNEFRAIRDAQRRPSD